MPPKGTKRKASAEDDKTEPKKKKPKQDGQKAVSRYLDIPIDEGFQAPTANLRVHIDEGDIIYDASLNQTSIGNNANKFYRLQLLTDGKRTWWTHTRWGRVGEFGQAKEIGPFGDFDSAFKEFQKKFKDKSGYQWEERNEDPKKGKYCFIQKSYERDEDEDAGSHARVKEEEDGDTKSGKDEVQSKLPVATQKLIELIFNEQHMDSVLENIGYNNDKLPLGKLGKSTVKTGFEHLKELANLIKDPKLAEKKYEVSHREAIEDFTNKYYSTIPHIFGRVRPPIIDNDDLLQKEVALLDTLSDMEVANNIMKTTTDKARDAESVNLLDKRFNELNLNKLEPVDPETDEFSALKKYLISTSGHTHDVKYRLQDIFRIERKGEAARWSKSKFSKMKNTDRRLLWHGSRTTNYGGILSQGLRIAPPEAPASGYAFGKGIYMADISTKSANYCAPYLSGGHGLLLLCEAELGSPMHELLGGDSNAGEDAIKKGCIATHGLGRTIPQGWVDAECVHESLKGVMMPNTSKPPGQQTTHPNAYLQYNEYISYDVAQLRLRYLLRVQM